MVSILIDLFIRDKENTDCIAVKQAYGVLCSAVGIGFNMLLFVGKFLAGYFSGSIAITADAFNNLSDAGSSLVTLIGFRLAGQKPDSKHPFGHGRIEYLTGLLIAVIIVLMGVELAKTSFDKILHPLAVDFTAVSVAVLTASIAVKLYMSYYNSRISKKIKSVAMRTVAKDSISDSIATAAVLVAMLIGKATGLQIDGYCGVLVALFILYTGVTAAKETVDSLLGQPIDADFMKDVNDLVMSYEEVLGIHDLIVHDYGLGRKMISLHAEVSSTADILETHDVIDNIEHKLRSTFQCEAVIHMDPIATDDERVLAVKQRVTALVSDLDKELSIHDFRMVTGKTHTNVIFDVVVPYDFRLTDEKVKEEIENSVRSMEGNFFAVVDIDRKFA